MAKQKSTLWFIYMEPTYQHGDAEALERLTKGCKNYCRGFSTLVSLVSRHAKSGLRKKPLSKLSKQAILVAP